MLLDFTITPTSLIERAKEVSGMELQAMARDLGYDKTRITKLKAGTCAMSASEVKYYADKADIPFGIALAEMETAKRPELSGVWADIDRWRKR